MDFAPLRQCALALTSALDSFLDGDSVNPPVAREQLDTLADIADMAKLPTLAFRAREARDVCYGCVPPSFAARAEPFTPWIAPAADSLPPTGFTRSACRAGAAYEWDSADERAEDEAVSAEWMEDVTGHHTPLQPHVARGIIISSAMMWHQVFPHLYADPCEVANNHGHFQKQNAQRASEKVAAGGQGKTEIVTRHDKARRAVNAAARKLDVEAARVSASASPLMLQAIEIIRAMLRPA